VTDPDYSQGAKLGASLLSPTAFGLALDQLVAYENEGQGVQFSNLQVRGEGSARGSRQSACSYTLAVAGWPVSGSERFNLDTPAPLRCNLGAVLLP
jgi:hypothetical protein